MDGDRRNRADRRQRQRAKAACRAAEKAARRDASATPAVIEAPLCADCGASMRLRPSRHGRFWGCTRFPACDGKHSAHPDGRPLGTPGDQPTRLARAELHQAFDELWRNGTMTRKQAYQWLQSELGLTAEECHIARLTAAQCGQALWAVRALRAGAAARASQSVLDRARARQAQRHRDATPLVIDDTLSEEAS